MSLSKNRLMVLYCVIEIVVNRKTTLFIRANIDSYKMVQILCSVIIK